MQVGNAGVAAPIPDQGGGYGRCFGLVLNSRQAGSGSAAAAELVAGSKKEHG